MWINDGPHLADPSRMLVAVLLREWRSGKRSGTRMVTRAAKLVLSAVCVTAMLVVGSVAPPARAQQGDVAAAASAFSRAQEAEARGDLARAASLYELADRLSPAAPALRNATRARMAAGQLSSAAVNAEELRRRYGGDAASVALAEEVLTEARQKLARLLAQCTLECHVVVDGLAASTQLKRAHVVYIEPGAHKIVARFEDETTVTSAVEARAGQDDRIELVKPAAAPYQPSEAPAPVTPAAPAAPAPPASPAADRASGGLSPVVGIVLGGAALALGAGAVWSGLDTKSAKDDFEQNPSREAFDRGEAKDTRTNVLIGASAAFGVASLVVLAFATDWAGRSEQPARLSVGLSGSARGPGLDLQGKF